MTNKIQQDLENQKEFQIIPEEEQNAQDNQKPELQTLSDEELQEVSGGFFRIFLPF